MILIKVIFLLKYSLSPSVISYTKVWHVPFRDFGYFLCLLVSSGIFTFSSLFRMHLKSKYSKVSYTFFHNYKITAGTSQIAYFISQKCEIVCFISCFISSQLAITCLKFAIETL